MLNVVTIKKLFKVLNEQLKKKKLRGELGVCGGAVMCLVFKAREATKDINGIFHPASEIRRAAARVAADFGLNSDWLNDAAKAYFHVDPPKEEVMELSHLRVWVPHADYMLAMKCISARFDTLDRQDLEFLIEYLGLKKIEKVYAKISQYYPHSKVPSKTQFLLEELFAMRTA